MYLPNSVHTRGCNNTLNGIHTRFDRVEEHNPGLDHHLFRRREGEGFSLDRSPREEVRRGGGAGGDAPPPAQIPSSNRGLGDDHSALSPRHVRCSLMR